MSKYKKSFLAVAATTSLLICGGLYASQAGGLFSDDTKLADQLGATQTSAAVQKLKANIDRALEQQEAELAEFYADYEMPAGFEHEPMETIPELQTQIEQLSALSSKEAETTPVTVETINYEEGFFKVDGIMSWQCAWMHEAVVATEKHDTKARDHAIKQLLDFKNSTDIEYFPDYDVFLQDNIKPLENNDTSNAKAFINNGFTCPESYKVK
ncbi:hypothetical protein HMPREF0044_0767 [Gleimia coleocanis DSM 15436]|uniref:Uncharacterized protein n=1 Tax=Gleimia coleocanis DSM 15436 TaxID=525245 RepID=C0W124_9ACTO|nr:hypothetical protein [Gleimia coleocanis]EEH63748.1 hypothetical protein HMPREF0044_0767 [Gleimia coleocanis DSM 15436]